ncbi:MAG: 16S rRNA (cytosine(967)-C(5))-methyltransferase RsmB [Eubacteriaceae bacterium]|nr:16S rRNA (cytosine(967)-C(5))-methyltransferase RsmB [Eubacteriaceae bacterium]
MAPNISHARLAAYKALNEVVASQAFSQVSLRKHLHGVKDEADRRLATAIVYGTLKRLRYLEYCLGKLSNRPLESIDPKLAIALMMGLYQAFFMDKIPEYAIVNDSVNIAKLFVGKSVAPFANGVLRTALRQKKKLSLESASFASFLERMEMEYGFSPLAVSVMRQSLTDSQIESYAKAALEPAQNYLRVNPAKASASELVIALDNIGIEAEETYVPGVLCASASANIYTNKLFSSGYYFAQDIASAISTYALDPQGKEKIIDLCAAPGGKSFGVMCIAPEAEITAIDISLEKCSMIQFSAKTLGFSIEAQKHDAREAWQKWQGKYSKAICDVPCSGLGALRRKPEINLRLDEKHLEALRELQPQIAYSAYECLSEGGVMLYSTCTLGTAENDDVVQGLLGKYPSARLEPIKLPFEMKSRHEEQNDGLLRLATDKDDSDGFFIAKIMKGR